MKVYIAKNLDGRRSAMVATANFNRAASALGVSANELRKYGWRYAEGPDAELALASPCVVFFRPIDAPESTPWRKRGEAARATE